MRSPHHHNSASTVKHLRRARANAHPCPKPYPTGHSPIAPYPRSSVWRPVSAVKPPASAAPPSCPNALSLQRERMASSHWQPCACTRSCAGRLRPARGVWSSALRGRALLKVRHRMEGYLTMRTSESADAHPMHTGVGRRWRPEAQSQGFGWLGHVKNDACQRIQE